MSNKLKFSELKEDGTVYTSATCKYLKRNGGLWYIDDEGYSDLAMSDIMDMKFEEVPRFTDTELEIMNAIDPMFNWIIRSSDDRMYLSKLEPLMSLDGNYYYLPKDTSIGRITSLIRFYDFPFKHIFKSIKPYEEATKIIRK